MEQAKRNKSLVREYAEAILLAILLALFIRTFVVQAFRIPTGSMIPTLLVGDQILVDKLVYKFRTPSRGEILVFKFPKDESRDFIKRLIGLPGDKLEIIDNIVYINDAPLEEDDYVRHERNSVFRSTVKNFGPVFIPDEKYFMMGDNRDNSQDSRFWGFLDENKIVGRAFIIYWSRDITKTFPLALRWNRFGYILR
ncbi:MAG: signal peptidase I [bacterium]|nr:MAG: signal peptidase I [bacterium]